jgi:type II secretory pathway component PulJ
MSFEKEINTLLTILTKDITEIGMIANETDEKNNNEKNMIMETLNILYNKIKDTSKKLDETIKPGIKK